MGGCGKILGAPLLKNLDVRRMLMLFTFTCGDYSYVVPRIRRELEQ